jgi:hypothetical protein
MNNHKSDDCSTGNDSLIEHYMAEIRKRLPVVDRALALYGELPLSEYLDLVTKTPSERYQSHEDLADVVYEYAAPLLGEEIAAMAREELKQSPAVLTANHHGVDYFAQSVQGTLLFSQRKLPNGQKARTVLVFACGNIPLDNITYPRGALLYGSPEENKGMLTKVPLFSNKVRRQSVSRVSGIDHSMLKQAVKRLTKQQQNSEVYPAPANTLKELLQEYAAVDVLQKDNYSDQSVLLNSRIWQRMFAADVAKPQLIYLELEKVAERLLVIDLKNSNSLVSSLLFDEQLRSSLITKLDTVSCCWDNSELQQRWDTRNSTAENTVTGCGTFMFWAVDEKGRRIPLAVVAGDDGFWLRGCDDKANLKEVRLTAESLLLGLQGGHLMPSVFTCFLVISLARGVTCAGGYYQAEYLSLMQQGVCEVLASQSTTQAMGKQVAEVNTDCYMSGMQSVMSDNGSGLIPAGPVEIISGGAINSEELQRITSLTLEDAHHASLAETMLDALHELLPVGDWQKTLAAENYQLLKDKVVIRPLY